MGLGFPSDTDMRDLFGLTDEDAEKKERLDQAAAARRSRTRRPPVAAQGLGSGMDLARVAMRGNFTGQAVADAEDERQDDTVLVTETRQRRRPITEDERAERDADRDAGYSM